MNIAVDTDLIKTIKKHIFFKRSRDHPGRFVESLGVCLGWSRALSAPNMRSNWGPKIKKNIFLFGSKPQHSNNNEKVKHNQQMKRTFGA